MRHSRTIWLFSEEFTEDYFLYTIKNSPEKSHHIWTLAHNFAPRQHFYSSALSLSLSFFSLHSRSLSLSLCLSLLLQDTRPPKYAMLLDENATYLLCLSLSLLSLSFSHTLSLPLLPFSFSLSLSLFKTTSSRLCDVVRRERDVQIQKYSHRPP